MIIDMSSELLSLKEEPLEELEKYDNPKFISSEETPEENPVHTRKKKLLLRDVCIVALMNLISIDKDLSGKEKNKRFFLAMKLQKEDLVDLEAEDIALLKKRIGLMCTVIVAGRAWQLLENRE